MIIGLGYKARVGKDTVADYLEDSHRFCKIAFADALKGACKIIFGLSREQLYGSLKDEMDTFWNATPRSILQKTGTECMRRGYRDDIWIRAVERRISERPEFDWVVSDVRFLNELLAIRSWGGRVIRIDRKEAPEIATATHASETELASYRDWDYTVDNNGTVEELHSQIDELLGWMGIRR